MRQNGSNKRGIWLNMTPRKTSIIPSPTKKPTKQTNEQINKSKKIVKHLKSKCGKESMLSATLSRYHLFPSDLFPPNGSNGMPMCVSYPSKSFAYSKHEFLFFFYRILCWNGQISTITLKSDTTYSQYSHTHTPKGGKKQFIFSEPFHSAWIWYSFCLGF